MAHRNEMPHRYTNEANETPSAIEPARNGRALARRPAWEAFWILRVGFTAAPILAGLDKFFHLLTNWDNYLAPVVNRVLGGHGHSFLLAAGVIEIIAGVGVALRPRIFGYVVSAWLVGIIINLLLVPGYYDVALRDLGLSLGALALARLSRDFDRGGRE